jgi:putative spermidine/putrescine transport system substrate-binding protein
MYRAKKLNPNLKVVIPQDGTALWSDVWVIPKGEVAASSALAWMNFCLTPAIAAQITALTDAVSTSELDQVPASVKADPIKFFSQDIFKKSELLLPLSQESLQQYKDIWTKMRSGSL